MKKFVHLLRPSPKSQLGPLEAEMMRMLWQRGNATVRELIEDRQVKQAYTTVMTTLDRLYKKKLLDREPEGRAFRYSPALTQQELEAAAAGETIRHLLSSSRAVTVPLSYFVEAVSEHDVALLDDLQRLLDAKRAELKQGPEKR
jgi:predicted transcriptional regulator